MIFFPGLHQVSDAVHFRRGCISINRLWTRRKPVGGGPHFIDSGAYTVLDKHGYYPPSHSVEAYAARLYELHAQNIVRIAVAAAQDYMCEPHIRAKTGLTIEEHQRLTVERYDALLEELRRLFGNAIPFRVMPVLQGQSIADYLRHIEMYGPRLGFRMWVGVGSVCKRQGRAVVVEDILRAIKTARPDLRLHGFGVKLTSLVNAAVRRLLFSADSMAWSFSARKQGRDGNDWREARAFLEKVSTPAREPEQLHFGY
ncbi:deazapurine DNA modification protein DpdA family protein [Phenylobacterium ferrooxidans]|uniref:DeoxyPurine in DNA protein A domain-containing protein n=1 Tax=Phenylobacterium ferrooxidans TaxID=2982689 RepID=A0ABW6CMV1_9CAUL